MFCIDQENAAHREMANRQGIEPRILDYCNRIGNSWQSLKFCVDQEEQARARLGR